MIIKIVSNLNIWEGFIVSCKIFKNRYMAVVSASDVE